MKNKFGKKIELLAPAGDFSRLKTAFYFGADAVYIGGKEYGLRAKSGNFSDEEIIEAVKYTHALGKKIYVTVNIFAGNADISGIEKYALFLEKAGIDAVIISDLGVLKIFKSLTNLEIHISTQANVCNSYAAMQYVQLGANRIILARELHIGEISEICNCLEEKAEIEVFVHGAMCISYSGRCLMSKYMTGRDANRGDCAYPCRYKYVLQEEKRQGEYFPIEEDSNGTYIMNSCDLCLIEKLNELAAAGSASFKIEGRMKNEYYVGGVVNTYRRAMNKEEFDYSGELEKLPHRPYTTGFTFNDEQKEFSKSSAIIVNYQIAALVTENNQEVKIRVKNKIKNGDEIEILSPLEYNGKTFVYNGDTLSIPEQIVSIDCPYKLQPYDILRKKV
ncbi:MAG: U32 family peptidase [Treponema sp.]|nr:U32 family peptidase [Treponema sp.]MCL2250683.1 U32 family peptidase [Treponema sp.]